MIDDDRTAVEAVQAGDTEAFRLLVERHKGKLFGFIYRMVADPVLAEELAHEAFVKAYLGIGDFRQEARFGTWLIQIGINITRDYLHRTQRLRRRGIVSLEELQEARRADLELADQRLDANPQAGLKEQEERDIMREAMARLPSEYREVLALKHFEGWPYERIAELTGDKVGSLKVRAHRARMLLRRNCHLWAGALLMPAQRRFRLGLRMTKEAHDNEVPQSLSRW